MGNTLALASLTTNAGGSTAINGGAVTTVGAQAYADSVTLGAATTLTTSNANITFSASLNTNANPFTIVAAKPSDDAGLVNIQVPINGRATSNISVLNIGETAAGNTSESSAEDSTEECKSSVNPSSNSPGASVMFNFGISLPAGVKAACI